MNSGALPSQAVFYRKIRYVEDEKNVNVLYVILMIMKKRLVQLPCIIAMTGCNRNKIPESRSDEHRVPLTFKATVKLWKDGDN